MKRFLIWLFACAVCMAECDEEIEVFDISKTCEVDEMSNNAPFNADMSAGISAPQSSHKSSLTNEILLPNAKSQSTAIKQTASQGATINQAPSPASAQIIMSLHPSATKPITPTTSKQTAPAAPVVVRPIVAKPPKSTAIKLTKPSAPTAPKSTALKPAAPKSTEPTKPIKPKSITIKQKSTTSKTTIKPKSNTKAAPSQTTNQISAKAPSGNAL